MKDTTLSAEQERELAERDERVIARLREAIGTHEEAAREYRQRAIEAEREITRIRASVEAGKWYDLEHVLDSEDVGSLCEISGPTVREVFR